MQTPFTPTPPREPLSPFRTKLFFFQVALNHGPLNYRLIAICIEDFAPFHHTVPHTPVSPSFSLRSYETFPPDPRPQSLRRLFAFPLKKIAAEARCIVGVRPPPCANWGKTWGPGGLGRPPVKRLRLPIGWAEEKEEAGDQKKLRTQTKISSPAPGAATRLGRPRKRLESTG